MTGQAHPQRVDVVVVGNGPAGLAAAAACSAAGLRIAVVAPRHDAVWRNTYGVWADELPDAELTAALRRRWADPVVASGREQPRRLARTYGVFDNARLRDLLLSRCLDGGTRLVAGTAVGTDFQAQWPTVVLADGQRVRGRAVVDASGHAPVLLARGADELPPAYQAAYGIVARCSRPPIEPGSMVLMDFSADAFGDLPDSDTPTFLYAMDFGDGRFLVEETSLAHRPAVPFAVLERRLRRRLQARGVDVVENLAVERVRFPMGTPLPRRDQYVIGFGAAAGMVHPATGFQVGQALARAPRLAAALSKALDAPGATGGTIAHAGWDAVWPEGLVRQRVLHRFGLEALLRLDTVQTQAFFSTFFGLPPHLWKAYLSGDDSSRRVAGAMSTLFVRVDWELRAVLIRTALSRNVRRGLLDGVRVRTDPVPQGNKFVP